MRLKQYINEAKASKKLLNLAMTALDRETMSGDKKREEIGDKEYDLIVKGKLPLKRIKYWADKQKEWVDLNK